jgi:hypothetical protein
VVRVVEEVAVERLALPLPDVDPVLAAPAAAREAPLEEQHVRHHRGPGALLERAAGQAEGGQQVGALVEPAADRVVGLVHRVARRDHGRDAAGADLFDRAAQEVVVDRAGDQRAAAVVRVDHAVAAERDVGDDEVVTPHPGMGLEAADVDRAVGVERPGDARADALQLDAGALAGDLGRLKAEEVPDAEGRFQDARVASDPEALGALPHGRYDGE